MVLTMLRLWSNMCRYKSWGQLQGDGMGRLDTGWSSLQDFMRSWRKANDGKTMRLWKEASDNREVDDKVGQTVFHIGINCWEWSKPLLGCKHCLGWRERLPFPLTSEDRPGLFKERHVCMEGLRCHQFADCTQLNDLFSTAPKYGCRLE